MKKYFEKNKINTEKILWVPNGIELDKFYHIQNEKQKHKIINDLKISSYIRVEDYVIIYVGNMNLKQKVLGMIDFLYSFKLFMNKSNEAVRKRLKLLYLGDGQYKQLLENEIKKRKLENKAFLLGKRREIEKFYAISDLCALTSHIEGFPTVLLEAITANVPCISTDVGEVDEILSKDSIVSVGDIEAIALKIQEFHDDISFRQKNLLKSQEKVKNFDWLIVAEKIKEIYKQIEVKE